MRAILSSGVGQWFPAPLSSSIAMSIGMFLTICLSICLQRSEEHTSELQSQSNLVCRLLLEKKIAEATLMVTGSQKGTLPVVRTFQKTALEHNRVVEASLKNEDTRTFVGCGQVLPGNSVVIADPESFMQCPPGSVGEIWIFSPSVAQGYWQRPEETERTFRAYLADTGEGPFLRTGDLGFFQDGGLFVPGRLKDLIIIRGRIH